MAKYKFDPIEVIESGIWLFRQAPYHEVSMAIIFEASGLQPGSFYNRFHSKLEFYKECFGWYVMKRVGELSSFHSSELGAVKDFIINRAGAGHVQLCADLVSSAVYDFRNDPEMLGWIAEQSKPLVEHPSNKLLRQEFFYGVSTHNGRPEYHLICGGAGVVDALTWGVKE